MYAMIAFGLYLIFVLIRFPIERASNARKEQAEAARAAARAEDEREGDQPFGGAGDDRYGRPPLPSNPQRRRVEPRL